MALGVKRIVEIPDIDRLMAGSLGQFLEEQRHARVEATAQAWARGWKAAMVLGPLLLIAIILVPVELFPKLWVSGFIVTFAFGWATGPIRAAKKRVKIGINEGIADALGMTYSHDGKEGREFDLAKQFRLVPRHQRAELEDFWSGELEGLPFLLHEAHLCQKKGSGKNRRWVTVFRGAIIRIASGRRFHGITLVQRAGKHKSWLGFGDRKDSVKFEGHQLDTVDMVHPEFDDLFEVWSDDQTEARFLVDPLYVERLLKLEAAFDGQDICSLFVEGDIVVAVRGGNMFEGGTMNPASDRFMVEKCAEQFASMGRLAKSINRTYGFGD
ncbi:DUF3137 domain-containing protein [Parerythrobacter jejuensis]|uniref:DUF3137 domain-containing protein n=1 Tax=Parerythrobacter jejuensis TaxID=795812 RepID=A0A845AZC1_9SPHN|nr:DUF3137 domain-containing protein [Parerythrobacter jejuensis]MXP32098.1 DUF3137 domain-containing protein [Parerythrobacter jejuensis]